MRQIVNVNDHVGNYCAMVVHTLQCSCQPVLTFIGATGSYWPLEGVVTSFTPDKHYKILNLPYLFHGL